MGSLDYLQSSTTATEVNVLPALLLILISFLWTGMPHFLFAVQGAVSISAVVPGGTFATTTVHFASGGTQTITTTQSSNAARVTFPPNFYNESLQLQTTSYPKTFFEAHKPPPSGKSFVGTTYEFNLFTDSHTQVTALNKAITISFTYTDEDVGGIDESTLAPYRRGSSDASWQLIPTSTVDTLNNRVTFSTSLFSSFALLATPSPSSPPPPPSLLGNGPGGGIFTVSETKVVFSGRAYPGAKVTVLKDAQIAAQAIADPAAHFRIEVPALSAGGYVFAIYAEDGQGRRSSFLTFLIRVTSGNTVEVGGMFIAPTVAVDKSEVQRGERVAVSGQSVPAADITVTLNSGGVFSRETVADTGGAYVYNVDTVELAEGQYLTASKAQADGGASPYSQPVRFAVGVKTVVASPQETTVRGDINSDGRVNLVDFSSAVHWYKKSSPPDAADLNGDGKVDLADFSIMAFYWTG